MASSLATPDQGALESPQPFGSDAEQIDQRIPAKHINLTVIEVDDVYAKFDAVTQFKSSIEERFDPTYIVKKNQGDVAVEGEMTFGMKAAMIEVNALCSRDVHIFVKTQLDLLLKHIAPEYAHNVILFTYGSKMFNTNALLATMLYGEPISYTPVFEVKTLPEATSRKIPPSRLDDAYALRSMSVGGHEKLPVPHKEMIIHYAPRERTPINRLPRDFKAATFGRRDCCARVGDYSAVLKHGEDIFWMEILQEHNSYNSNPVTSPVLWFNGHHVARHVPHDSPISTGNDIGASFVRQFFAMTGVEWNDRNSFDWSKPREDLSHWTYIGDSHEIYSRQDWWDHEPAAKAGKKTPSRDASPMRK